VQADLTFDQGQHSISSTAFEKFHTIAHQRLSFTLPALQHWQVRTLRLLLFLLFWSAIESIEK